MKVEPKKPSRNDGWTFDGDHTHVGVTFTRWRHVSGFVVTSGIDDVPGYGPTYHVAVSRPARRATDADVLTVLFAFDMLGAEEENAPGTRARHFWRVVE